METLFCLDPASYDHDTGPRHPERPARLDAVRRGVEASPVPVRELFARAASVDELALVHDRGYIDHIREFCEAGGGFLDPDTLAVEASWRAALLAAGAGLAGLEALDRHEAELAFLAVRPPGHHALVSTAMGFCLFNNIAVVAAVLAGRGERVAIVDWDVHHGNGTQDSFWNEPNVLYISLHQHPFYPFTGMFNETGAFGNVLNIPVPATTAGDFYRTAFDSLVVPRIRSFAADWVLVSCGFDAYAADPLAELRLLPSDYAYMANRIVRPGRTMVFLEGGYDLVGIEASTAAMLAGFAGLPVQDEAERFASPSYAYDVLELLAP